MNKQVIVVTGVADQVRPVRSSRHPFAAARPDTTRMLTDDPSLPEPPIFGLSNAKLGYVPSNLACMG